MNINIYFNKLEGERNNIRSGIYRYCNTFSYNSQYVEILSSHKLTQKEIESLGKLYFNNDPILRKGYIDLIIDKYIIDNYK